MDAPPAPFTAAILAPREATASTLYGMVDLLKSAGRDYGLVVDGKPGESLFAPSIVARDGAPFESSAGLMLHPHAGLEASPAPDLVVVPDLLVGPNEKLSGRYEPEVAWLRACYAGGSILASACAGGLLVAEAGLLDGHEATTHWGYCETMQQRYPDVRVHGRRALIATGPGQRIVMAGGGTTWQDLALYLIARLAGVDEAMRVARIWLIEWHDLGQQPFATVLHSRQRDDALIADGQEWVARHFDRPQVVAEMTARSGLSERSFQRRFAQALGMTPLQYVQALRLEEAKHLLESGDDAVEAVARAVGYEQPAFFGRLFRREVGMTPLQYRRRFGGLRRELTAAARAARSSPGS